MISAIIPAFNAKNTIRHCIDSILAQSYDDFEIIVINDGSTDGTDEILQQYHLSNVFIYNVANHGVSNARNYGLSKAKGDWVTFIDADDWIEQGTFSEVVRNIDSDTDVIVVNIQYDGPVKKEASYLVPNDTYAIKDEIVETTIDLYYGEKRFGAKYGNSRCIGGKFYRRSKLKKEKIAFDIKLTGFEDGIFNLYSYQSAKKIKILSRRLYHYVYNSNARTSIGAGKDQIHQDLMALLDIKNFLKTTGRKSQAIKYCCVNMASTAVRYVVDNNCGGRRGQNLQNVLKMYESFLGDKRISMQYLTIKRRILYLFWRRRWFKALIFLYCLK